MKITVIEALDHVLSMMDKQISDYTERHFRRENIEVLMNTFVKAVKQREVVIQFKGSDELHSIPCAVIVWATGIKPRALTNRIREAIGLNVQTNRMGLLTDRYLRVKGVADKSIFAIGDCATIEQAKLVDRIQLLFEEADTQKRGALDLHQFKVLVETNVRDYPQVEDEIRFAAPSTFLFVSVGNLFDESGKRLRRGRSREIRFDQFDDVTFDFGKGRSEGSRAACHGAGRLAGRPFHR